MVYLTIPGSPFEADMPASTNMLLYFLNGFLGTNTCRVNWNSLLCGTSLEQLEKKTSLANKIAVFIFSALKEKALLLKNNKKNSGEKKKKTSLGKWVLSRVPDGVSEVCPRLRLGAAEKV